jgi:Glycosyl transferase 4-like domain
MLLENNPYPQDIRVRNEAQSLVAAGHRVEVVAPRAHGQPVRERVDGVVVRRFRAADATSQGISGMLREFLVAAVALHLAAVRALVRGGTVLHIHNPPDILFLAVANHVLAANESHAEIAVKRGGKAPGDVTIVRNGPPASWTRLPLGPAHFGFSVSEPPALAGGGWLGLTT